MVGLAQSPPFKVYRGKQYIASCRYAEDAAAFLALCADAGGEIRYGHGLIVWREGRDGRAWESYDAVASLIRQRVERMRQVLVEEIRRPRQADVDAVSPEVR